MCVLALAWRAHPKWRLVAVGNRDELHARPALPLARWDDVPGVIAGRDAVAGGTWLGVSEAGRFAVVTNVRSPDRPDPAKASRGKLVIDSLTGRETGALDGFNPFNLFIVDGDEAVFLSNRPAPIRRTLTAGIHGLSNGLYDEPWPKTVRLEAALEDWIAGDGADAAPLFAALADERLPGSKRPDDGGGHEPVHSPVFIRHPVYGTRCSTVVTVDDVGHGMIAERRFSTGGAPTGETRIDFAWPVPA